MRKPGRPKDSTNTRPTREVAKQIRWTQTEWDTVVMLAHDKKQTPCEYIRRRVLG